MHKLHIRYKRYENYAMLVQHTTVLAEKMLIVNCNNVCKKQGLNQVIGNQPNLCEYFRQETQKAHRPTHSEVNNLVGLLNKA